MQFLLSGQDLEHKRILPTFWSYKNLYKKAFTAFRRQRWEFIKETFQEKNVSITKKSKIQENNKEYF